MKRFLLVDDHSIVRSGLKLIIKERYFPAEIDEASDGDTAFEKIRAKDYDLIMLDLHVPDTDVAGLVNNILRIKPQTSILIFSMSSEDVFAKRYLQMGIKGFLNKENADDEIIKAIDIILNGKKYISDQLMLRITNATINEIPDNPFDSLSNREIEIVVLLAQGKSVGEITQTLNIQNSTVGTHKARIFEKLNVNNVIDLRELAKLYQVV